MRSPPTLPSRPPKKKLKRAHGRHRFVGSRMVGTAYGLSRRVAGSRLHLVSSEIEPWCTFQSLGGGAVRVGGQGWG